MYDDLLTYHNKKYDFKLIAEKLQQLLNKKGVKTDDYELDESGYYDGVAFSYTEHFPMLDLPVNYRIFYDSFYGEDSIFSASVGVPRGKFEISDMECRKIPSQCRSALDMMISFEGRNTDDKYIGIFHVIDSVRGKHVMDLDEMQRHLYEVRCMVTDIAYKLFERCSESYLTGQCDAHATVAKFEQVNSLFNDDRLIIEKDCFEELSDDQHDTIDLKDTIEITELLYSAEFRNDETHG